MGGGVVAEIFRDRRKPGRFSGGGGVVAEIFRDRRKPGRFNGGGGVVADIFRDRRKPGRFSGGGGGGSSRSFWASPITISQPHSVFCGGEGVVGEKNV